MTETPAKGKVLWIYNVGMDRFSWGFYQWRTRAAGRWEWHFCFPGEWSWEYYAGQDWYLPYADSNGNGPSAPYAKYKGGMLYRSSFLTVLEGINDYRYIYTLSEAVKAAREAGRAAKLQKALDDAEAFLKSIDAKVPEFPQVRGLTSGADVGKGLADDAARSTDAWRKQIAELLTALAK